MPRKPRFYLPGVAAHIVQRGNCRQAVFFDDVDYQYYLGWLSEGAERYGCAIHAYVLMTNHVHLLMTPILKSSISRTIQHVGRCYVTYVNRTYGKSGTLWEGRHKGNNIDSENYLLACMRYIEMNPVRAGMTESPNDYPWSSFACNALGRANDIVTAHTVYERLGESVTDRLNAYRGLFSHHINDAEQLADIRNSVQTGTPLGNVRFRRQIEATLKCKVGQTNRGRPKKIEEKGY